MNDSITPSQKDHLLALSRQFGLEPLSPRLVELARPCIAMAAKNSGPLNHMGCCRLGGIPDVPAEFVWPKNTAFLMQLNLAQIGPLDESNRLPRSGMLYFFLGDDEARGSLPHQVIYSAAAPDQLRPAATPPGYNQSDSREYEGGDTNVVYKAFELAFQSSISLPHYGSRQYDAIADGLESENRSNAYFALQDALKVPRSSRRTGQHQMLGYCSCIDVDADVAASFARHGLDADLFRFDKPKLLELIVELQTEVYSANRRHEQAQRHTQYLLSLRERQLAAWESKPDQIDLARREVDSWVTLLDLDSDLNAGMCFWDAGRVHFMIPVHDLSERRFDRTYAGLISS
jgi:uncharacterized protein YwqG